MNVLGFGGFSTRTIVDQVFFSLGFLLSALCICIIWGCEDEANRPEAVYELNWEDALSINIEGGSLTQSRRIPWGEGVRYEIELSLESLKTEMSMRFEGCEPMLVSF